MSSCRQARLRCRRPRPRPASPPPHCRRAPSPPSPSPPPRLLRVVGLCADAEGRALSCGGPRVTTWLGWWEAARGRRRASPRAQVRCGRWARAHAPPSRRPLAFQRLVITLPPSTRVDVEPVARGTPRLSGGRGAEAWANGAHLSPERRRIKRRPAGLRLVRACVLTSSRGERASSWQNSREIFRGGAQAGRQQARIAWSNVRAGWAGATSHDTDRAPDTRGSRNASASER